ncbi:class I SAM-dependent DNA methyltransferase [Patulibacter americanus]|uniref:class I SAM-dependent DNA methyltransferase n=1 Tax=Patulibacter americanus TaxID=588672 RepID=UPI0003B6F873|nr:class I SAM-dependent methyltransferase [Patulibacter americanus]
MSLVTPQQQSVEHAYDQLSPVYDAFMAHVDYDAWLTAIVDLAARHGVQPPARLLDAGCGSGLELVPLMERGFAVSGFDLSSGMLARARERVGDDVRLVHADVRTVEPLGEHELVLAVNDVLNFLHEPDDLRAALRSLAANVAPGGLLILDGNTLLNFATVWALSSTVEDGNDLLVWRGLTPPPEVAPGMLARAVLEAFTRREDGAYDRVTAVQEQCHHTAEAMGEAIAAAGLELVATHGMDLQTFTLADDLDEFRHPKAVFVARRP